jgi:uncharacterized protein (DUF2147 family)
MRRELSLVGVSLLVYACALVLGSLIICETVRASELVGEWPTQGNAAHVRVDRCHTASDLVCGVVTWLWEPLDAEGGPMRDKHNPDPKLRARPILGLSLLEDFRRVINEEAMEGRIYNPENGRTYRASLRLRSADLLEVKGCLLIACDTQVWRRVESVCAMHPKQSDPARSQLVSGAAITAARSYRRIIRVCSPWLPRSRPLL